MAESWESVLDQLEADIALVQRELDAHAASAVSSSPEAFRHEQVATWVPPRGLGPLPEPLVPRVRDLVAAQALLAERLAMRMTSAADDLTHLRPLPTTLPAAAPHVPVFVDAEF